MRKPTSDVSSLVTMAHLSPKVKRKKKRQRQTTTMRFLATNGCSVMAKAVKLKMCVCLSYARADVCLKVDVDEDLPNDGNIEEVFSESTEQVDVEELAKLKKAEIQAQRAAVPAEVREQMLRDAEERLKKSMRGAPKGLLAAMQSQESAKELLKQGSSSSLLPPPSSAPVVAGSTTAMSPTADEDGINEEMFELPGQVNMANGGEAKRLSVMLASDDTVADAVTGGSALFSSAPEAGEAPDASAEEQAAEPAEEPAEETAAAPTSAEEPAAAPDGPVEAEEVRVQLKV